MRWSDARATTSPIATTLLVAIVVILAALASGPVLEIQSDLSQPSDQRVFTDAQVVLGVEHRSWGGWKAGYGGTGDPPRGDVDHVSLDYQYGPVFEATEVGAILIEWRGDDGSGGTLRFVNPGRFDRESDQQYHGGSVGEFCTGELGAGERLTIRMAHNRWQSGGQTDPEVVGERYVESNSNDVARGSDEPFFRVSNRYPVFFDGDRPIEPKDRVEITFLGPNDETIIAETTAVASVAAETPTELTPPEC